MNLFISIWKLLFCLDGIFLRVTARLTCEGEEKRETGEARVAFTTAQFSRRRRFELFDVGVVFLRAGRAKEMKMFRLSVDDEDLFPTAYRTRVTRPPDPWSGLASLDVKNPENRRSAAHLVGTASIID